jgi:hypothetical protein
VFQFLGGGRLDAGVESVTRRLALDTGKDVMFPVSVVVVETNNSGSRAVM